MTVPTGTGTSDAGGSRELPIQLFERTAPLAGRILFLPRVAGIDAAAIDAITARATAGCRPPRANTSTRSPST